MTDKPDRKVVREERSDPPPGCPQDEWDVYLDGMVKQTREAERQARTGGTRGKRMHYGNSPWGEDPDPAEEQGGHD